MTERVVIGSLGDLAAVPGLPSEPTLRKLIRDNPDFPVVSNGTNGRAYEIDVAAAVEWIKAHEEKRREAERAQREEVRQYALELLGPDAAADQSTAGLSPAERQALLQEELTAIKVAERRGQLIRKDSVEEALSALLVMFRERDRTFTARLSKRLDLTREQIAVIDTLIEQGQLELADRMARICEVEIDADAATGTDPAV